LAYHSYEKVADEARNQLGAEMEGWQLYSGSLDSLPIVTACFDESGHSASTRVVAMGGAMATPKQWRVLKNAWTTTLNNFGVESFHMVDFENRRGNFSSWDEDRKRNFLRELFDGIDNTALWLIGSAAVVEDFNRLGSKLPRELRDPWYLCYESCFREVLSMYWLFDPDEEGVEREFAHIRGCFFEQPTEYAYGPLLFMEEYERRLNNDNGAHAVIGWAHKGPFQLELADLIAYELRKHVENAIFEQGRPTRWPMKQLFKKGLFVNVFDRSRTQIPTEGSVALFRCGYLTDPENGDYSITFAPLQPNHAQTAKVNPKS
jgi:hypothetical protein